MIRADWRDLIAGAIAALLIVWVASWFTGPVRAKECGIASWYAYTGHRTASGRPYTGREMTAAHKTLPFGSRVRVTNVATGRSIVVTIDDRGPFVRGRIIDLSRAAARALGMGGLAKVCVSR